MTENEWANSNDLKQLLNHVGTIQPNLARLISCIYCHSIWDLFLINECRRAIASSALYLDGVATDDTLRSAFHNVLNRYVIDIDDTNMQISYLAMRCVESNEYIDRSPYIIGTTIKRLRPEFDVENVIRDIFPFRKPESINQSKQITDLALAAYNNLAPKACSTCNGTGYSWGSEGYCAICNDGKVPYSFRRGMLPTFQLDNSRLLVLSDAIEDAEGCNELNDGILKHLRLAKPHYRGCWVLDYILGKQI